MKRLRVLTNLNVWKFGSYQKSLYLCTVRNKEKNVIKYVKKWNKDFLSYHTNLYKNEEKVQKALEENPLEKAIGHSIEDYLENYQEGLLSCNSYIEGSNSI